MKIILNNEHTLTSLRFGEELSTTYAPPNLTSPYILLFPFIIEIKDLSSLQ